MSRVTVPQYTKCLLPEDVKTDSVTIHKVSSAWRSQDRQCHYTQTVYLLKMSRQTVPQYTKCLLPKDVKTDSVTIHKLSIYWICQDWQCHIKQTVKRSFYVITCQCAITTFWRQYQWLALRLATTQLLLPVSYRPCDQYRVVTARVITSSPSHCCDCIVSYLTTTFSWVQLVIVTTLCRIIGQSAMLLNWQNCAPCGEGVLSSPERPDPHWCSPSPLYYAYQQLSRG